jgi:hypothetical protein
LDTTYSTENRMRRNLYRSGGGSEGHRSARRWRGDWWRSHSSGASNGAGGGARGAKSAGTGVVGFQRPRNSSPLCYRFGPSFHHFVHPLVYPLFNPLLIPSIIPSVIPSSRPSVLFWPVDHSGMSMNESFVACGLLIYKGHVYHDE